jgi:uncharacterized protein involved in exopolysaccharide biosynthesis
VRSRISGLRRSLTFRSHDSGNEQQALDLKRQLQVIERKQQSCAQRLRHWNQKKKKERKNETQKERMEEIETDKKGRKKQRKKEIDQCTVNIEEGKMKLHRRQNKTGNKKDKH